MTESSSSSSSSPAQPEPKDIIVDLVPVEPSADMREMAHHVREMFVALVGEGFTENQALVIVGQILSAGIAGQSS